MKRNSLHLLKLCLTAILLLGVTSDILAQNINTYTFTQSSGTYTPITGTSLTPLTSCYDDNNFATVAIPFTFTYHGAGFTSIGVSANGYATLNATTSTWYSQVLSGLTNCLAPYSADLYACATGHDISYTTLGSAPNRTFVVQFTNHGYYSSGLNEASFQIRLNETSNSIVFIYGSCPTPSSNTVYVGINGATTGDYNTRTGSSFGATTAGTNLNGINVGSGNSPANGLTFTFAPPSACSGAPLAGTVSAVPSQTTYCGAASPILNVSGNTVGTGITYQWQSSPNGTTWTNIIGATTASYSVPAITTSSLYRLNVTCTNSVITTSSSPILINVAPNPSVSATTSAAFICGSGSVTLNAYGASSYSWSPGTGLSSTTAPTVTASPTANTTYIVTGTLGSCTATAAVAVNVAPSIPAPTTTATPAAVCFGASTQLATSQATGTAYSVYNIAPVMQPQTAPTTVTFSSYDDGSTLVSIPFTFDYYGNNYTSLYVGTNGFITFGTGSTSLGGHTIPAATTPNNIISLFWHDLNLNNGGTITYSTEGTTPNRKFIVNFNNVKDYSDPTFSNNNGQIVLYETTNIIDLVVTYSHTTSTTYSPTGSFPYYRVLGIENSNGTAATVPTGRNYGTWSITSPEGYRFARPAYNYAWTPSAGLSSAAVYNPTASNVTSNTTYNVLITDAATGCTNTGSVAVTVNPAPTATMVVSTPTVCAGDQPMITFTGTPNAQVVYNINGANPQTVTLNGSGSYTETAPVVNSNSTYALVSATNTTTTCSAALTATASVAVNPRPAGLFMGSTSVCRDQAATISYGTGSTTFPIDVTFSDGTNTYTATATGSSENFPVPTDVPGVFSYEITALSDVNGCNGVAGTDFTGTAVVDVKALPTAVVTSTDAGVCAGGNTDVTITFTGDAPYIFSYYDGTGSQSPAPELTNTFTFNVAPAAATTYYVESLLGGSCLAETAGLEDSATVVIWDNTAITTQPMSVSACSENSAMITMTATGEGLSYVWYENGVAVSGPNYTPVDNTLTINNITGLGGNDYHVVVSGTCGTDQTSDPATLTEDFGNQWGGATSTAWSDATNWSCGTVPIITTNVTIVPGPVNMPLVDIPTAVCNDFTLLGGTTSLGFTGVGNQLAIHGNLTNTGGTFNGTDGTIEMAGTTQSITGALTFDNLDVNGGGTKTLNGDVIVEGILNLMDGNIELGNSNLTLTQPTLQMGGSDTSFVVTNGMGSVIGQGMGAVGGNPDAVMFHVGIDGTSYTPMMLENLGDVDTFSVRVMENVYVDGDGTAPEEVTNPVVDRTWMVSEMTDGGSIVNMTPYWNAIDETNGFDQAHVYVAHYMGGEWTSTTDSAIDAPAAIASGAMWTTTEDSIMSFSPFAVASYGQFPLAIRLTSITAANAGPRNKVEWRSATEDAGDKYELERSTDAKSFTKIATVAANGKPSTYTQWDESPVEGVNYYRVKLLGTDGRYSYSKVVSATVNKTGDFTIEAYPNPVHNTVSVKVNGVVTGKGSVVVTDVTGKIVSQVTVVEHNGAELNVSHLANGIYLLNYSDDVRNESIKINKQ